MKSYPVVLCLALSAMMGDRIQSTETISFRTQIAPILLENCVSCHGPKKAEGGYRADTYHELVKPGDSGVNPLDMQHAKSELYRRVIAENASQRMPAESDPLQKDKIELLAKWIDQGGVFDGQNPNDPLLLVIPPLSYPKPPAKYAQPIPISAITFTADGSKLLAGGYHEVTIWDVADGKLVGRIPNLGQHIYAMKFLADGKTLAVGCGEPGIRGEVRLIDFHAGSLSSVIARASDVVLDLAQSPKGSELAVASADSLVRIVNIQNPSQMRTIASHADWVTSIAWSDDGSKLASASRDKSVKVYDAKSGELTVSYAGHSAAVRSVAFLPDGNQLLSAGADNKLHRWSMEGAKKIAEVGLGGEAFKIFRGSEFVMVPSTDKKVRRIELAKNNITQTLVGHDDWVLDVAVHEGTQRYASSSLKGEVRIWNATDGMLVRSWIALP